jgi:hypothetical protein
MALEPTLSEITARIREGKFTSEQAVSQGIVLQELSWDLYDVSVVCPEYKTGEGRVDFCLCHPPSKPAVVIEVKQPGKAEDAVKQALGYAFHTGAPFVVLTDGRTWSFYLPAEQGSYEDRRVYKLDLYERPPKEASETLQRYLARARVVSGEALETARKEYQSRSRRAQACAAIPETWRELAEKGDELLVEMLASAVESKSGVRPDVDDVAEFLATLGKTSVVKAAPAPPRPSTTTSRSPEPARRGQLVLKGKTHSYQSAKDAMVIILRELANADHSFLQRCSQHPDIQGRKRRYIARTAEELYPDREDLRDFREALPDGWWVATNLNNVVKKTVIRVAAEVAGLSMGKDVIVEF